MLAIAVRTIALASWLAGCSSGAGPVPDQPDGRRPAPDAPSIRPDSMAGVTQQGTRLHTAATSGFTGPEELVLRDRAGWQAAWARLHEGMGAPPVPDVDFAREMVVVVALGERNSGGFAVRFDGIAASGADATVRYTVTEPGPGCLTTQAITAPVDVVRVPRMPGAVRFEPRTVREDC